GGITACDEVAGALVNFMKKNSEVNLVVRLRGNNQDIAAKMLAESGLKLYPDLDSAVKEAVERSTTPVAAGGAAWTRAGEAPLSGRLAAAGKSKDKSNLQGSRKVAPAKTRR